MKEKIIEEIVRAINNIGLSKEEKAHLDTYVKETVEKYSSFIMLHEDIIKSDKELEELKKSVLKLLTGDLNV